MGSSHEQTSFIIAVVLIAAVVVVLLPTLRQNNDAMAAGGVFPGGTPFGPPRAVSCGFSSPAHGYGTDDQEDYINHDDAAKKKWCPEVEANAKVNAYNKCRSALVSQGDLCPRGCTILGGPTHIIFSDDQSSCTAEPMPNGVLIIGRHEVECRQICYRIFESTPPLPQ